MTEQTRETDDATPCDESAVLAMADCSPSKPEEWLGVTQHPLVCKTLIGETLGVYRINSVLGQSATSTVYLAARVDQLYSAPAAIKVLNGGVASATARQFVVEKYTLGQLSHPSIARLYDAGELTDGRPYLVMEYVEGEPLDKYCDSRQLGIKERINLFLEVCSAVHYAHQHLVVHRDLKPSNILVTKDGIPKLLDFGIAKWLDKSRLPEAGQALTRINDRVLTPEYASPEQVTGRPIATTSDVYTLGVVLYELLSGSRPYQLPTRDHLEVERLICILDPTSPSHYFSTQSDDDQKRIATLRGETPKSLLKTLQGDLDAILMRALRKEPTERYESVEQFTDDLTRYLNQAPVLARQGNWLYYTKRFVIRRRVGLSVAALFLVCSSAAATVLTLSTQKLVAERNNADHQKYKADTASNFWLGMFDRNGVLPNTKPDTALNLLDRAAEQIKRDTQLTPDIRAQVLVGMGKSYQGQAKPQIATTYLEEALRSLSENNPTNAALLAVTLNTLGSALNDTGKPKDASEKINTGIQLLEKYGLEKSAEFFELKKSSGEVLLNAGYPKKSEVIFTEILPLAYSLYGAEDPRTASLLLAIGRSCLWQSNYLGALSYLKNSTDIYNRLFREYHPYRIESNLMLAYALSHANDVENAEEIAKEQLRVQRNSYGNENLRTVSTLEFLSGIAAHNRKPIDAKKYAFEALKISQDIQGDDNPNTALLKARVSEVLISLHEQGEAESLLAEAIPVLRKDRQHSQYLTFAEYLLAKVFAETRRNKQAMEILKKRIDGLDDSFDEKWRKAAFQNLLASLQWHQEHDQKSKELLSSSWKILSNPSNGALEKYIDDARGRTQSILGSLPDASLRK